MNDGARCCLLIWAASRLQKKRKKRFQNSTLIWFTSGCRDSGTVSKCKRRAAPGAGDPAFGMRSKLVRQRRLARAKWLIRSQGWH